MIFRGIKRSFSLVGEEQYDTIGAFWDEMAELYGLERLIGLGYGWHGDIIEYAIGLKDGEIPGADLTVTLPDEGWVNVSGRGDRLKEIYDEIYKGGRLDYELETFDERGDCVIRYYRKES